MPEPEHLKILSLEEVREAAESVQLRPKGEWAAAFVARLCATVEHWHAASSAGKMLAGSRISALVARMRDRIERGTTYMDREDLARYLDTCEIDAWAVKVFSSMRETLNDLQY